MRTIPARSLMLSVSFIATACGSDRVPSDDHLPIDSVRVVPGPDITWHPEPLFVVGAVDADGRDIGRPISRVTDAIIRSDTSLAVMEYPSWRLPVFDREGAFRLTIGSEVQGEGPGEFGLLRNALLLPGDSILGWDLRLRRMSEFDGDGSLNRVVPLADPDTRPMDMYLVGSERLVVVSMHVGGPTYAGSRGLAREEHDIFFLDREGREIAPARRIEGTEHMRDGAGSSIAAYDSHRLYAAAGRERFFVGHGRGPWLVEYAPTSGEATRHLHLPIERSVTSSGERSARIEAWVNARIQESARLSMRRMLEESVTTDSLPAFIGLVADRDGHLWVREHLPADRRSTEPGRWLVVDPERNEARWVRGLPGWNVLDAAHGLVAAVRTDDLGRETVGVFEIAY